MNHLYFGDCLDVLKQLKEEQLQPFIDLIYIDRPFNSKRNYNVLFESIDIKDANAQKQAFADTWSNYGYDGYLTFNFEKAQKQFALIETKSGKLTVKNLREFVHVIDTQKAAVGIFVCFEENKTREMIKTAKDAGHIKINGHEFPQDRIQILTIEDLLNGRLPQLPGAAENKTFKKAQRNEDKAVSRGLFD